MPDVIVDTSPLQYLYQADLWDLLPRLYESIIVPEAVAVELAQGRARGLAIPNPGTVPWIAIVQVERKQILPLATDLGPGEREVLALGVERPGARLILDDALARRYARLLGLTFTGTLGTLLKAKQLGLLPSLAPVLARLDVLGFRLDSTTRDMALRLSGEH